MPKAAKYAEEKKNDGLQLYVIYGENGSYSKPTQAQCVKYAQKYGVDPANMLIDNEQGSGWYKTFDAIENYGNGSVGLPWYCVLDGRSMEYYWSNATSTTSHETAIEELLAKP